MADSGKGVRKTNDSGSRLSSKGSAGGGSYSTRDEVLYRRKTSSNKAKPDSINLEMRQEASSNLQYSSYVQPTDANRSFLADKIPEFY